MVVMIEDDKADDYIILRYNETGRRNINGQSGLDLMLSVKEREPELWVVVISYMDNKDKRQKMVLPNFLTPGLFFVFLHGFLLFPGHNQFVQ